uniref:RNA-dependent RNA polymerase n=1 Tax=Crithidia G15 virus TaxID=2022115 RepID=A0A2R2X358_9VIRU|nr:RNA-dependent RNA polymerase [Crithidia G15 virus]
MYRNNPYEPSQNVGCFVYKPTRTPLQGLTQYPPARLGSPSFQQPLFSLELSSGLVGVKILMPDMFPWTRWMPDTVTISSVRKLPHDVICKVLWGQENESNILEQPIWTKQPEGVCTPDWFSDVGGTVFVFEVKTFKSRGIESYYNALSQYSSILQNCNRPAVNMGICVGDDEVILPECLEISSYNQSLLTSLCLLAHRIQDECHRQGWLRDYDYVAGTETVVIPSVSLPMINEEKLIITEEMRLAWKSLPPIPDPVMLINKNIKKVKPPHQTREDDKASLFELYQGLPSSDPDQTLRSGLLIPYIGDSLPPRADYLNPILHGVLDDFFFKVGQAGAGVRPKHVYLRSHLDSSYDLYKTDILRGLWTTYFMFPDVEVFRSYKNGRKPSDLKVVSESTRKGASYVSPSTISRTDPELRGWRNKKSAEAYRPGPLDIEYWSSLLFEERKDLLPQEMTTVEGAPEKIPFQDEVWAHHSRFWQRLVEEINIGRYSAKGDWNRFHVQKIDPYEAYLFVHGTGNDSHQFYYLVLRAENLAPHTGLDMIRVPGTDWWYTSKVQSMNSSKISQWLNLHERLTSLRFFWSSVFNTSIRRSKLHFAASFLIGFEAKQTTIDALSLFRYLYMEMCKEKVHRNVYKLHSKLPKVLRTPVQCWVCHSLISMMINGEGNEGVLLDEDDPTILDFKSLRSWVDNGPVPSFSTILSLSYMHYVVPHPFSTGLQGRVAIMEKLLKEEATLPKSRSKIGWSSPMLSDLKDHEFSVGFVKAMGQEASRFLRIRYSTFSQFWEEVSNKLRPLTYSAFSTFKKSTRLNEKGTAVREFCFETIKELAGELGWSVDSVSKFSPFSELHGLVDHTIKDPTTKNVTIFVKDQQTGLREIFVLTMCMRILVKFMEVTSRVINTCLPNETLSVPSRKDELIHLHSRKSLESKFELMKQHGRDDYEYVTLRFSSSSDAKSWCQQFCMPAFGCFYESCLSEYGEESEPLIKLIHHILNMITQKHIHVDPRVKEWFRAHPNVLGHSDTFNTLSALFNGDQDGLYEDDSIINLSNMMQGIPHETSSALHASYLMLASSSLKELSRGLKLSKKVSHLCFGEAVVTNMVSSDDSGIMFSLPVSYSKFEKAEALAELEQVRKMYSTAGYNIEECKRLFSAKVSLEKSTIFAETPVYEFNSKFYVGVSVNTAEIKFVCSPFTLGYHTIIRERMSEALSTLSGCLREGVRQDQLNVVQCLLRRMHHRFLYFDWWDPKSSKKLDRMCSPILGTLPLVREGLIGFFNLQNMSDYLSHIESPLAGSVSFGATSPDVEKDLAYSLSLKLISRYQKVLSVVLPKFNAMIDDYQQSQESSLKYLSRELFESELVVLKLMSPGTRIAMSYVDVAKIHMASCYAATQPCIRVSSSDTKVSLREAFDEIESIDKIEGVVRQLAPNPTIKVLVDLLNDTYRGPALSEQARFAQHMPLVTDPKNAPRMGDMRVNLIEGWKYGFAGERLTCLNWARTIDGRITAEFNSTFSNMGSDIRELDRSLHSLELRSTVVHVLCFKPLNNTLTEKYASFLSSSMSRSYSLNVGRSRFVPEPSHEITKEVSSACEKVMGFLSMEALGWPLRKISNHMRSKALGVVNRMDPSVLTTRSRSAQLLLLQVLDERSNHEIDLRELDIRGNKRFFVSDTRGYLKVRTHWYVLSRDQSGWKIGRTLTSPILRTSGLEQVIAQPGDFILNTCQLMVSTASDDSLSIKSRQWNSESHKSYPASLSPKKWECTLYSLTYYNLSISQYCDELPEPYNNDFCKKITRIAIGCGKELGSWKFWRDLSTVKARKFGSGAHSLAYKLLSETMTSWTRPEAPLQHNQTMTAPAIAEDEDDGDGGDFADFMDELLAQVDFDNVQLPEDVDLANAHNLMEEVFSFDYFPGMEYEPQEIDKIALAVAPERRTSDDVIRRAFMKHCRICYVSLATKESLDEGLFGPPEELIELLSRPREAGRPVDLKDGDFIEEPGEELK